MVAHSDQDRRGSGGDFLMKKAPKAGWGVWGQCIGMIDLRWIFEFIPTQMQFLKHLIKQQKIT